LNLARILRGTPVADLPVLLAVDTRLLVNARTAAAIGWAPSREVRLMARFLHEEALGSAGAMALSLESAYRMSEDQNRSLAVSDARVESVRHDEARARSALLPQVLSNVSWVDKDDDLLSPIGDDATVGSLTVRQLIYDDRARSSLKASRRLTGAAEHGRETDRLDVLAQTGQRYMALGLAEALYRVELENLRLTEDFLELARLRRDVGYSGRDEVLRWEASLAQQRSSLMRAAAEAETGRIALNQSLSEPQSQRWQLDVAEIDAEEFPVLGGRLDGVFDAPADLERFRGLAVGMAIENAPELDEIGSAIEAQEIRLAQLRRRYGLPTVFAEASYSSRLAGPSDDLPSVDDDYYTFILGLSYPIFEGGLKRADINKALADLQALQSQRDLAAELVEQRTRTAIQRCESSFPRIRFSRESLAAARGNLELVADQYAEGLVNVTDLLSAQGQAFTAEQLAVAAVHEFLIDLVGLQRSLSWFEHEKTASEQDAFVDRATPLN
jgi:outer membrane protein TolC